MVSTSRTRSASRQISDHLHTPLAELDPEVYASIAAERQANQTVYLACLKPGDTVLSMELAAGGHLSHGAKPNMAGKWFNVIRYGVAAVAPGFALRSVDRNSMRKPGMELR
jgi:glycine/serine hydroxymethyltransferase